MCINSVSIVSRATFSWSDVWRCNVAWPLFPALAADCCRDTEWCLMHGIAIRVLVHLSNGLLGKGGTYRLCDCWELCLAFGLGKVGVEPDSLSCFCFELDYYFNQGC